MAYGVYPNPGPPGPVGPPGPPGPAGGLAAYGSWSHSVTIPISTNAAPTIADYDTANIAPVGLSLVAGTRITVASAGIYEFSCSPQVNVPGGAGSIVTFWPRTGAGNVPDSASTVEVGNNSRYALPFVTYLVQLSAGAYVEFCFHGVGDSPRLLAEPATAGPPSIPASPAIIVTAKRLA